MAVRCLGGRRVREPPTYGRFYGAVVNGRAAVATTYHCSRPIDATRRRLALGSSERAAEGIKDVVAQAPAEVLVKGRGFLEHRAHIRDAGGVPRADVLVEDRGIAEHPVHRRDAGGVPRANVLVEGRRGRVAT